MVNTNLGYRPGFEFGYTPGSLYPQARFKDPMGRTLNHPGAPSARFPRKPVPWNETTSQAAGYPMMPTQMSDMPLRPILPRARRYY